MQDLRLDKVRRERGWEALLPEKRNWQESCLLSHCAEQRMQETPFCAEHWQDAPPEVRAAILKGRRA